MAERIYWILLRLYPVDHRQAFGQLMLQHARDLERDYRQRGGWQISIFYLRLVKDGILNAGFEQWEAIMANNRFTPASWLTVLLATIPGLMMVFNRVNITQLGQILPQLVAYSYLAILIIGVPLIWYRQRRFPAWGLLPAGLVFWNVLFLAGNLLTGLLSNLGWLSPQWADGLIGFALIEIVLTVVLAVLLLSGQRLSVSAWLACGAIVLANLLLTVLVFAELPIPVRLDPDILLFLYNTSIGLLDGLLLVAAGLLAVRQHGTLAMLVLIGGYGYMLLDSDFISGFRLNQWAGYPAYTMSMAALFMVVTPIALLRARTRLGRLLAVFIPIGMFQIARIAVPNLVLLDYPHLVPWGDIMLSLNVLLNFVLAWVLYSNIEKAIQGEEIVEVVSSPPQPLVSGDYH
jgi:hypothetical protein